MSRPESKTLKQLRALDLNEDGFIAAFPLPVLHLEPHGTLSALLQAPLSMEETFTGEALPLVSNAPGFIHPDSYVEWLLAEDGEKGLMLGRGLTNDIVLAGRTVSKNHLQLIRRGEEWFAKDVGARNGSFLNEERLEPNQERMLKDGDRLRLASDYVARFMLPSSMWRFCSPLR